MNKEPLGESSLAWLGRVCDRGKRRATNPGLWNQNHVDEGYDPACLDMLEKVIEQAEKRP